MFQSNIAWDSLGRTPLFATLNPTYWPQVWSGVPGGRLEMSTSVDGLAPGTESFIAEHNSYYEWTDKNNEYNIYNHTNFTPSFIASPMPNGTTFESVESEGVPLNLLPAHYDNAILKLWSMVDFKHPAYLESKLLFWVHDTAYFPTSSIVALQPATPVYSSGNITVSAALGAASPYNLKYTAQFSGKDGSVVITSQPQLSPTFIQAARWLCDTEHSEIKWRVRCQNPLGVGAWSPWATFTVVGKLAVTLTASTEAHTEVMNWHILQCIATAESAGCVLSNFRWTVYSSGNNGATFTEIGRYYNTTLQLAGRQDGHSDTIYGVYLDVDGTENGVVKTGNFFTYATYVNPFKEGIGAIGKPGSSKYDKSELIKSITNIIREHESTAASMDWSMSLYDFSDEQQAYIQAHPESWSITGDGRSEKPAVRIVRR